MIQIFLSMCFLLSLFTSPIVLADEPNSWPKEVRDGYYKMLQKNLTLKEFNTIKTRTSLAPYSNPKEGEPDIKIFEWFFPDRHVPHTQNGWRNNPSKKIYEILRMEDKIIWNVQMNIDKYSRRVTPFKFEKEKPDKFIMFFGCSFVFGTGINDNETLPYFLANKMKDYVPYNYATGAMGTHQLLSLMENTDLKKQVPEKNGIFIYVYANGHIERSNGFMHQRAWNLDSPFYKKVDNKMERAGTFSTEEPIITWFYDFLSNILNYSTRFGRNFPRIYQRHTDYTCNLIVDSKRRFLIKYPDSHFFVSNHRLVGTVSKDLRQCLEKNDVALINHKYLGDRFLDDDPAKGRVAIEIDLHPTALYNKVAAELISDILLEKLKK
jgi:hypothetical protein